MFALLPTIIWPGQSQNVPCSENLPLPHGCERNFVIFRLNRWLTILAEIIRSIMHDWFKIINGVVSICWICVEVILFAALNISIVDCHKPIAILRRLHVIESESMKGFMHDGSFCQTSTSDSVWNHDWNHLSSTNSPNITVASVQCADKADIVSFVRLINESDTRILLEWEQSCPNQRCLSWA